MLWLYFILSKDKNKEITNNDASYIVVNNKYNYMLPYNNIYSHLDKGIFKNSIIEWCKELSNKDRIMLDIGSHTGTFSISLSNYYKKIYAFEPQKMTYYALCGGVALSNCHNIECVNYAIGSQEQVGNCNLNIIREDGFGSTLLEPINPIISQELVRVRTLDSFNFTNIGFIKLNTEGNELNVLKGSLNTLKESNNPSILFKSNNKNYELYNFLHNIGYTIININDYSDTFLAASIKK